LDSEGEECPDPKMAEKRQEGEESQTDHGRGRNPASKTRRQNPSNDSRGNRTERKKRKEVHMQERKKISEGPKNTGKKYERATRKATGGDTRGVEKTVL